MIILYLGIFVTGIACFAYFKVLEISTATNAAMVFFLKPVLAPFAVLLIVGERPTFITIAALILFVVGSIVATLKKNG